MTVGGAISSNWACVLHSPHSWSIQRKQEPNYRLQTSPNVTFPWIFFSLTWNVDCPLLFGIQLNSVSELLLMMQGRAGKVPKKELVIQSPQQFKGSAEAEVEAVTHGAVSPSPAFVLKTFQFLCSQSVGLNGADLWRPWAFVTTLSRPQRHGHHVSGSWHWKLSLRFHFPNGAGAYKIFYLVQSLTCAAFSLSPVIKVWGDRTHQQHSWPLLLTKPVDIFGCLNGGKTNISHLFKDRNKYEHPCFYISYMPAVQVFIFHSQAQLYQLK